MKKRLPLGDNMYMHINMARPPDQTESQPGADRPLPCLCAAARKAARVLTRNYDAHLKPSGLLVTQFSMLMNIARRPGMTVSGLAKLLMMDQTTVTRNLVLLEKRGYIRTEQEADDQRIKRVFISDSGRAKLDQAKPLWAAAQKEMEDKVGRQGLIDLLESIKRLVN